MTHRKAAMHLRYLAPLLLWVAAGSAVAVHAEIVEWSIPGSTSWEDAQQQALTLQRTFPLIDFRRAQGGIAPLDTTEMVPVPTIPEVGSLGPEDEEAIRAFGRHVSRDSVLAQQAVESGDSVLVRAGDLLLAPLDDFPSQAHGVRLLRQAGVDSARALVNLIHAVLVSKDARTLQGLLTSPTIYRFLMSLQVDEQLRKLIDGDPETAFIRVDQPGRDVKQKIVVRMDLATRFPVGLVRFYPRPIGGIRLNSYRLDANDGIAVIGGAGRLRHEPAYSLLQIEQTNPADTVAVRLDPPQFIQRFRFESLTLLDYDIAEFEAYNQGFLPTAVYLSTALPFDEGGLTSLGKYFSGDLGAGERLARLEVPVLGRVFWEEEKVGDATKSEAALSMQIGQNPETERLYRVNANEAIVEWRPNAVAVDSRDGVSTAGAQVNLDDVNLQSSVREIWNRLAEDDRLALQTTTPEYLALPPGNRLDPVGHPLPREPNRPFWSGFQPLVNGQTIPLPAGRPFFQFRVELTSRDPGAATLVRNLRFEMDFQTAARQVLGEVVPATGVVAGVDTTLIYALRPQFGPGDTGFNRLRINTPTRASIEHFELAYGDQTTLARRQSIDALQHWEWTPENRMIAVGFPKIDQATSSGDSLVVLVHLRGRVLDLRSDFSGQVFLDPTAQRERTEFTDTGMLILGGHAADGTVADTLRVLPQYVTGGDAFDFSPDLSDRNSLQVLTSVDRDIEGVLSRVRLAPDPFTPNADDINDELTISYDILRVVRAVPVAVEVFDLSGRRVKLVESLREVGEYSTVWDGMGAGGHPVPPGTYVVKLSAATETGEFSSVHPIAVAY